MPTSSDREWMYKMTDSRGYLCSQYCKRLEEFLEFAFSNEAFVEMKRTESGKNVPQIRCPCPKCKNTHYYPRDDVHFHLISRGFMPNYTSWYEHGEMVCDYQNVELGSNPVEDEEEDEDEDDDVDGCRRMVLDNMCHTNINEQFEGFLGEEEPNPDAKNFYDMLKDGDKPLWDGCQNWSKLRAATRLLNWKSDCNVPESTFNYIVSLFKTMLPVGNNLADSFYETKKILKNLSLPKKRIAVCKNHCMIFYKETKKLTKCLVCNEPCYKGGAKSKIPNLVMTYLPIAPRLQRLYMSGKTAKEMTWHNDHKTNSGSMVHPSDGKAWKHFDETYPLFANETRNVRLGLCTDGFSPTNTNSTPYSLWPVFLTIYNLPPWMCLKDSFVQLSLVIPGRKSPGQNLDVFLRPLIDDLQGLWNIGVITYDAYRKENFRMRAILLWTVSDFPAYAMLSGWSTHGKLACPYCIGHTDSFQLKNGGKPCWFDCHRRFLPRIHAFRKDKSGFRDKTSVKATPPPELTGEQIWEQVRHIPTVYEGSLYSSKKPKPVGFGQTHNFVKRSIFWELEYWRKLLIRHNLDPMHIEKNVFENLFQTVMDTSKTKDNIKARKDVELYCSRSMLHLTYANNKIMKPKASFTLTKQQVKKVCEWLKYNVKFPDGYASNIGGCVNLEDCSFYSFKSHDCHVLMQRWDPEIDAAVRKAWNNTMADRYADIMSQERTMAIKRAEKAGITVGSNYALIKAFKPSWIKQDFWDTMIDEEWNTDQWKNKSDKGKANKATLKNGMVAKHTCGSRKMSQTRRKMDLENGFTTTQVALYTKCHSRQLDDGTSEFITPTAENTIAEYKRLCFESFGPDESTHPLGDLELWTKAVGWKKKGRVRGAPSDPAYVVTGTSISSSSRSSSYFEESASAVKIQKLEEKVEELLTQTKKLEDLRKEEHLASQAREQEINKKMDEKLEAFQRMVLGKIGSS